MDMHVGVRMLFICASLEPGKDGVGDYSRRLASVLIGRGVSCHIVALNDGAAEGRFSEQLILQECDGQRVPAWRFSASRSWKQRLRKLQAILDDLRPDWVSLQFVPYGFQKKGVPWFLPGQLARLQGGFRWHIMFHELWLPLWDGQAMRYRAIGAIQRYLIKDLIQKLRPIIHTSNEEYLRRLAATGASAEILPLFSNIPVVPVDREAQRLDLLKEGFGEASDELESDCWIFVFFGALHPEWSPEPLMRLIEKARLELNRKRCLFLSIGRLGLTGERSWESMVATWSSNPYFAFCKRGQLPVQEVSACLQAGDFGIAASPYSLLGKSGSAVAMREHGLPVIVTRMEAAAQGDYPPDEGLVFLGENFAQALSKAKRYNAVSGLSSVVDKLTKNLQGNFR